MKIRGRFLAFCVVLLYAAAARAQPDLRRQELWDADDKKEFLKYIRSNQGAAPAGEVKDVSPDREESAAPRVRKARYATLNFATDTVFSTDGSGRTTRESTGLGPKLVAGGHLFSWIRYYGGVQHSRFDQLRVDGNRQRVTHWQVPVGLEFALIPLGTPHTRYVLMRAGITAHNFSSDAPKSDFRNPLLGWQGSWNAGLGYEWQFESSPFRFHALAEGYKSLVRHSSSPFYGLGFTTGFVYTF